MSTALKYQVLVVGAGPAGAAVSTVLQQSGISVLLVDTLTPAEQDLPKIGESLPGAALRLLQRLGIVSIEALLDATDYSSCLVNASAWGTPHWSYRDALVNPEGGGWHLLRQRFDQALRNHAKEQGVSYLHAKFQSVTLRGQADSAEFALKAAETSYHPESAVYRTQLKTATGVEAYVDSMWVIDATGRKGVVARQLGGSYQRIREQYAVAAWLESDPSDHEKMSRVKTVADGWWYTARLPNQQRVAVFHGAAEPVAMLVRSPEAFLDAYQAAELLPFPTSTPHIFHKPQACDAGIKRLEKAGGMQWLAVGDAALSFDPLSAQGIFFALYSGVMAGELIAEQLNSQQNAQANAQSLASNVHGAYQQKIERVFAQSMSDLQRLSVFS